MFDTEEEDRVHTFLDETRILIPGAQILGGFLLTVPLQSRYGTLTHWQNIVYLVTFCCTMLSLVLFMTPAVYHRMSAPMSEKKRFVWLGTRIVNLGMVPLTVSIALAMQLVGSMVLGNGPASWGMGGLGLVMALCWWLAPRLKVHERAPEMD